MKRFWIGLCAACVLALCVVGIVWVIRFQQQARIMRQFIAAGPANLAREQAAARQAGIPLDPHSLQQPLPPPSQNAAPLYVRLTKLLHDKPLHLPKYAEGMDAFHSYTPAQIAAVRTILSQRQDVMTLVHQAADKPKCVFVRDWNKGPDLMFPEYLPMREAARLLKTESYLLARDGHYQEAVANQARGFRVAEHAASDPILLASLVGDASEAITLSGMQSILAQAGPNLLVADDVRRTVAERRSHLSLRRAMAGEAGFGCTFVLKMHQAEDKGLTAALAAGGFPDPDAIQPPPTARERQGAHALIDAWEADYLARMRPLVIASGLPPIQRRAAFVAAYQDFDHDMAGPAGTTHLLTLTLMPVFRRIDENDTRTHAREAVTLAAADVLAERAKTGVFPNNLPQESADPFTNKPLGYRREGVGGFVVYSVGPTGHFDGGKPGQKAPGAESLFRFPAVPLPTH